MTDIVGWSYLICGWAMAMGSVFTSTHQSLKCGNQIYPLLDI